MTAYDWLMAVGLVVIIGFVVNAFWRSRKVDAIEQSDSLYPGSGPTDSHMSGED